MSPIFSSPIRRKGSATCLVFAYGASEQERSRRAPAIHMTTSKEQYDDPRCRPRHCLYEQTTEHDGCTSSHPSCQGASRGISHRIADHGSHPEHVTARACPHCDGRHHT